MIYTMEKRSLFLIVTLLFVSAVSVNAQITIGRNTNPHPSALLDLESNSKGLLLPRVALTADPTEFVLNQNEVGNEAWAVGMIVYNTNAEIPNGKGVYLWDGVKWSPICGGNNKPKPLNFSLSRAVTDLRPEYDAYKLEPVTMNVNGTDLYMLDKIIIDTDLTLANLTELKIAVKEGSGFSIADFENGTADNYIQIDLKIYFQYLDLFPPEERAELLVIFEGYFGEYLRNVSAENNATYSFYVVDRSGNKKVESIVIDNIRDGSPDKPILWIDYARANNLEAAGVNEIQYLTLRGKSGRDGSHIELYEDIDCTGISFDKIMEGTWNQNGLTSNLDGKNHKIFNAIAPLYRFVGDFYNYEGEITIQNIHFVNADITVENGYGSGGAIACGLHGNVIVDNCSVSGSVTGGGLAGETGSGDYTVIIRNCFSSADVIGSGGIVGYIADVNMIIENCYFSGNVYSSSVIAGGILGNGGGNMIIRNCFASGSVEAAGAIGKYSYNASAGGIVGYAHSGTIENCYALNTRVAGNGDVGKIVGSGATIDDQNAVNIIDCYAWDGMDITLAGSNYENGAPVTLTQAMNQATYIGWDFDDVWTFDYSNYTTDGNTNLSILKNIPADVMQAPHIGTGLSVLSRAVNSEAEYQAEPVTFEQLYMADKILVNPQERTIVEAKWAKSYQTVDYFAANGTTFNVSDGISNVINSVYSVYLKDDLGVETVHTITISRVRDGKETKPYLLINRTTADGITASIPEINQYTIGFMDSHLNSNFEIYENIDASAESLLLGSESTPFIGKLNGRGKNIENTTEALFEEIGDLSWNHHPQIFDLNIVNANAEGGALAIKLQKGSIFNCSVSGEITGVNAGAFAAESKQKNDVRIQGCYSSANVTATGGFGGGIVGLGYGVGENY